MQTSAYTYQTMKVSHGHLVIETDANGYELVLEVHSSAAKAKARKAFYELAQLRRLAA